MRLSKVSLYCPLKKKFLNFGTDETIQSLEEKACRIADPPIPRFYADHVPEPTSVTYVDYENPFVSHCTWEAYF